MKKRSLIIIAGVVAGFSTAAITTGVVYSLKTKSTTKTEDKILDEVAKKVKVDYTNKEEIEASKFNKTDILFSDFDKTKYEIVENKITVNKTDNTKLNVVFKLKDIKTSDLSEEITFEISGFKKPQDVKPPSEPQEPENPNIPVNPHPETPTDPEKELIKTKEQLDLIAQKLKETDFVYSEKKTNLPVAYINKENFKVENLSKDIKISILNIASKTENTTIAIVKYELTKDELKSDIHTIEITGFESVEDEIKRLNELAKKPNSVQFTGGDKKDFELTSTIRKSLFSFKDLPSGYTFDIIGFSAPNRTTLVVSYQIFKTGRKIKSDIQKETISGFKAFDVKGSLNKAADNVKIEFDGNKATTEVKNIDKTKLLFKNLDLNRFVPEIVSVTEKPTDSTIAVVKYTVKGVDGKIKSDIKTLDITGFKLFVIQKTDLDEIIKKETVNVENSKYIFLKKITNLDDIKLKFSKLPNDIIVTDVTKTKKTDDDSKLVVKFKIKSKTGTILSDEKTLEIDDFQTKLKTQKELDADVKKIKIASYKGDPKNVEFKDINIKNIVFTNFSDSYEIAQIVIVPSVRGTSAIVNFRVKEKDGTLLSDKGFASLRDFKKPSAKTLELNAIARNASPTYEDFQNTAFQSFENVNIKKISFSGIDESKYEVTVNPFVVLNSTGNTLDIFYNIKEKSTNAVSDVVNKKIKNFVSKSLRKEQIDKLFKDITADYTGKSGKILSSIEDVDKNKIMFKEYDDKKYKVTIKDITFGIDHSADEGESNIDKTSIDVKFTIKEISSGIESSLKSVVINGFKKA